MYERYYLLDLERTLGMGDYSFGKVIGEGIQAHWIRQGYIPRNWRIHCEK